MSRLLIHAGHESAANATFLTAAWRVLVALASSVRHRGPLSLQIDDVHGCRMLAVENAGPVTEVPLQAGTYHVIACRGRIRRRYTMTLEPETSFDLYLRLTAKPL